MLSDSHWMGELGQPGLQAFQCSLLHRTQVRSHIAGLRIVPLVQFRNQLKQPGQSIGTFKAGASLSPQVRGFLSEVLCGQALPQLLPCRRNESSMRKSPDQPHQQPMSMHRIMPVVAAVKGRRQFSGRGHVSIAIQAMTNFVRIFLVHARECKIRKPLSRVDVKHGRCSGVLSTSLGDIEEQENHAGYPFHFPTLDDCPLGIQQNRVLEVGVAASPPQNAQTRRMLINPESLTSGAKYSFRTGSSLVRSVLKYFLLSSGKTVTTTASGPSCSCTIRAARRLQPEEMPTASPSVEASFCAMTMESPSETGTTSSSIERSTSAGINSSEMPWMRCLPTLWPVDSVGDSAGSTG